MSKNLKQLSAGAGYECVKNLKQLSAGASETRSRKASMCQSREEECEVKEDRAGADEQAGVVALTREGV